MVVRTSERLDQNFGRRLAHLPSRLIRTFVTRRREREANIGFFELEKTEGIP